MPEAGRPREQVEVSSTQGVKGHTGPTNRKNQNNGKRN